MSPVKFGKVFTTVLFMVYLAQSAVIEVAKDLPMNSIQKAVEEALEGDVIEILDDEVYEEQVTIDSSKTGLTIRGNKNAKPTIKWQDTESTFPKNVDQAQSETFSDSIMEERKYFDQNGALRIIKARDVTIENVIVNGGGAKPFCNKGVWYNEEENEYYDLLHGNAAIVLTIASNVIIRNCEITNAYFGISVKDRNMRGAFAEPNPSDIARYNIVPLSGFGKSGNHIFENNRIHANSWGIFFESTWDMGSTIRYNLIYSNYHHGTVRSTIDGFSSSEGNNQIGGGILFKDDPISPVAIYNNTFRDNTMNIACQWQAGAYHLIFNNIFSKPHAYTNDYGIAEFSLEGIMPERYKHNLYAAQGQAPGEYDVRINNNMNKVGSGSGPIEPGSLISGGSQPANWTFPSGANNRWLEVPFKSTSASSPDFLVPDWDDPLVEEFIVDQGWPGAGIRDADETIADIGAITSGGIPETRVAIKAVNPVILNNENDEATVRFNVYPINGELQDLTIKYVQWMGDLPKDPGWANAVNQGRTLNVDRPASPQSVNISHTPVMGLNSITFKVEQDGKYAFLEIILEGKDSDGSTVTTNVGFLPYRQLEYIFDIELYADETSSEKIKEVQVGDTVYMRVVPQRVDGKEISRGTAEDIEISLNSPFNLLGPDSTPVVISSIPFDGVTVPVVFTRIPAQGWDVISVNGIFRENTADQGRAIMGTSEQIDINPGDPAEIRFLEQSRNHEFPSIINPGENLESKLQVFDKYGNKVKKRANVSIASTEESIGAPLEPTSAESDDTGVVSFEIVVTNGGEGEVFQLVATLTYKDKDVDTDTAYLKVGKITDRFVIFYSDTNGYDPTVIIDECSSERVPVTIRAIAADTIITSRDNEFTISFDKQGLAAYSSETSTEPVTRAALVNGEAVIWIQPNIPEIKDASIEITRTDDRTILNGKRGDINFVYCDNPVESAFYFTDYGNGTVNRVELHFRDPLDEEGIPDTMIFYWPDPSVERIVTSGMTIDSEDPSIMTIILAQPFDSLITARGSSPDLGVCIRVNEDIGSVNRKTFEIEEKVGPLLMSAIVVERLTEEGNDTLFLTFSEFVNYENLEGNSLILIKGETTVTLNILYAMFQDSEGDTIRVIVENTDNNLAPKEGDLLRINPEGPAKDNVGNFAHVDNRPVVIMQKEVPPDILSAYYYDKDGNGIVDTVIIEFNKAVKLEALSAEFTWAGKKTGKIESNHFSFVTGSEGLDNSRVAVDVSGRFQDIKVKTSENMRLTLEYSSQASAERTADVLDKAAPVITSAVYHPGAMAKGQPQPDTLNVTFSEKIADPGSSSSPFRFYRRTNNANIEYEMDLKQLGTSGNSIRYLVNSFSVEEVEIAENGDSVRIKTPDIYGDENGNLQNVSTNRLVPVEVKSVPLDFTVKVGPNPFIANGIDYVTIKIDPQTKMVENVDLDARVRIYDPLGNVVFDQTLNNVKEVKVDWEGRNIQGRFVGSGTYLAIVEATDLKTGKKMKPSRHPIGIKR